MGRDLKKVSISLEKAESLEHYVVSLVLIRPLGGRLTPLTQRRRKQEKIESVSLYTSCYKADLSLFSTSGGVGEGV